MSRGKRFESARRLSRTGGDKPNARGRGYRGTAGEGLSTSPVHYREGVPSPIDGRRGVVLLVAYVLAPGDGAARFVDLLHGYVGHEAVRGGAVLVVLTRLEEHAVAGADHLDLSAAALAEADSLGDVDGLAVGVGVPGGSGARGEVDAAGREAGWLRGCRQGAAGEHCHRRAQERRRSCGDGACSACGTAFGTQGAHTSRQPTARTACHRARRA